MPPQLSPDLTVYQPVQFDAAPCPLGPEGVLVMPSEPPVPVVGVFVGAGVESVLVGEGLVAVLVGAGLVAVLVGAGAVEPPSEVVSVPMVASSQVRPSPSQPMRRLAMSEA